MVGIVVVSHSRTLARAATELAAQMLHELAQQHKTAEAAIQFARGYLLAQQAMQPADLDEIRGRLHKLPLPHIRRG